MSDKYISEDKFRDDWGVIQKSDGGMFECVLKKRACIGFTD